MADYRVISLFGKNAVTPKMDLTPFTTKAQFTLLRQGGCGSGSVELAIRHKDRMNIDIGDYVAMAHTTAENRWYLGRIEEISAHSDWMISLSLNGMIAELSEVFMGGFGIIGDLLPHLYAQADTFTLDPDHGIQEWDVVTTPEQVVRLVLTNQVYPRTNISPVSTVETSGVGLQTLKVRGEETVAMVFRTLATIANNASWGVDQFRRFFFINKRNTVQKTFQDQIDIIKPGVESQRSREHLINRILLTGDFIYWEHLYKGDYSIPHYRYRGTWQYNPSVAIYGERRRKLWVPWIRNDADALKFCTEFFRVYGVPIERHKFTTVGQSTLIYPWLGRATLLAADGSVIRTDIFDELTVDFNHVPRFTLTLGPEDPQLLEAPQAERYELKPDEQFGDNISSSLFSNSGTSATPYFTSSLKPPPPVPSSSCHCECKEADFNAYLTPTVPNQSEPQYFNLGNKFCPGTYRIRYQSGAIKYSNDQDEGWRVNKDNTPDIHDEGFHVWVDNTWKRTFPADTTEQINIENAEDMSAGSFYDVTIAVKSKIGMNFRVLNPTITNVSSPPPKFTIELVSCLCGEGPTPPPVDNCPVDVTCSTRNLPTTLALEFGDCTDDFAFLTGLSFTLTWDTVGWTWTGLVPVSGQPDQQTRLLLVCTGDPASWSFEVTLSSSAPTSETHTTHPSYVEHPAVWDVEGDFTADIGKHGLISATIVAADCSATPPTPPTDCDITTTCMTRRLPNNLTLSTNPLFNELAFLGSRTFVLAYNTTSMEWEWNGTEVIAATPWPIHIGLKCDGTAWQLTIVGIPKLGVPTTLVYNVSAITETPLQLNIWAFDNDSVFQTTQFMGIITGINCGSSPQCSLPTTLYAQIVHYQPTAFLPALFPCAFYDSNNVALGGGPPDYATTTHTLTWNSTTGTWRMPGRYKMHLWKHGDTCSAGPPPGAPANAGQEVNGQVFGGVEWYYFESEFEVELKARMVDGNCQLFLCWRYLSDFFGYATTSLPADPPNNGAHLCWNNIPMTNSWDDSTTDGRCEMLSVGSDIATGYTSVDPSPMVEFPCSRTAANAQTRWEKVGITVRDNPW